MLHARYTSECGGTRDACSRPKEALQQCLRGVLRARMRVVYGREVGRDETSGEVVFRRSASAEGAAQAFMNESRRLGYMNLLPRNVSHMIQPTEHGFLQAYA